MRTNTPRKIITHHSGGTDRNPKASTQHHTALVVDQWHMKRWPGFTSQTIKQPDGAPWHVGYHYVIEADGTTVQTRAHHEEGAHCIGMNTSSIGILVMGNFDTGVDMPTEAQVNAYKILIAKVQKKIPHLTVYDIEPHRKYATKSCWGSALPNDYWRGIVMEGLPVPIRRIEAKQREYQRVFLVTTLIELAQQWRSILIQALTRKRLSTRQK